MATGGDGGADAAPRKPARDPVPEINPNIPAFMVKAPWYMGSEQDSLIHAPKSEASKAGQAGLQDWYRRGAVAGPAATKYRKGACANCGSISHKTSDCLERPRKRGAKWTGKDIRPDEVVQSIDKDFSFDAKRDRWNGYDPAMYKEVVERYEALEQERLRVREEALDSRTIEHQAKKAAKAAKVKDDDFDSSSDEDDTEPSSVLGDNVVTDRKSAVSNLRIREDRAKYLYDLNTESAHYDPKTRSMRDAPLGNGAEYAGDAFERAQGDQANMQQVQKFAWQAESRGCAVHMQANPTVNELQFKEYQQKKEKHLEETKSSILDKYGGEEHLKTLPKELMAGQSEHYVEYSPSGEVIRGQQRAVPRSRYEEDVLDTNHTAIWGSWYDLPHARWGYRCCHNTVYRSYCTGQAGIDAASTALPTDT